MYGAKPRRASLRHGGSGVKHEPGVAGPPNKAFKLTKLAAAPGSARLGAAAWPRRPVFGATASQLNASVGQTCGVRQRACEGAEAVARTAVAKHSEMGARAGASRWRPRRAGIVTEARPARHTEGAHSRRDMVAGASPVPACSGRRWGGARRLFVGGVAAQQGVQADEALLELGRGMEGGTDSRDCCYRVGSCERERLAA